MPDRERELNRAQRFIQVPNSWEGWVLRIMTIALVLVFVAVYILFGAISRLSEQLGGLEGFVSDSRAQRTAFQNAEQARQCLALERMGVGLKDRGDVGC